MEVTEMVYTRVFRMRTCTTQMIEGGIQARQHGCIQSLPPSAASSYRYIP